MFGFFLRKLRKISALPNTPVSNIAVVVFSGTSNTLLLLASILVGVGVLDLPERWLGRVRILWFVVAALQIGLWVNRACALALAQGGIAIALAMQNILADVSASLSIAVDKPFEVGDFIVVGSLFDTVEHVGLKTTRIRSLGGE